MIRLRVRVSSRVGSGLVSGLDFFMGDPDLRVRKCYPLS